MSDMVNHPPHYTSHPSGVEAIQVTRHMNFNLGNATKYIWRAGLKDDSIQDLEKAMFYIADEITRLGGNPSRIEKTKIKDIIEDLRTYPDEGHGAEFLYCDDLISYMEEL